MLGDFDGGMTSTLQSGCMKGIFPIISKMLGLFSALVGKLKGITLNILATVAFRLQHKLKM
jgi:hypothetical protein